MPLNAAVRVLVTRPRLEAERWAAQLREQGLEAHPLPLIALEPVPDAHTLHAAWQRLAEYQALMFVSAAAVRHFFAEKVAETSAARAEDAIKLVASRRWWATGAGTAAALQDAGVPPACIDTPAADAARFDSETLWAQVRAQVHFGSRVLIVRGGDTRGVPVGRDWLARAVVAAGGQSEEVAAYRRLPPAWGEAECRLALSAAQPPWLWLFSSSQAIEHLATVLPEANWRTARAVATHPRIAQAAQRAGFGQVCSAHPGLGGVVASIKSFE